MCGIYKIININNNKIYIGSAINIKRRKSQHFSDLRKNKHNNQHLQYAFNKYGSDNFLFEIIEECEKENLIKREQYWIDILDCCNDKIGYNICQNAGNTLGRETTEETRNKQSISAIGKHDGEKNPFSIFKNEDIVNIKILLAQGMSITDIAKKYNTKKATISAIKHERNWKNIIIDTSNIEKIYFYTRSEEHIKNWRESNKNNNIGSKNNASKLDEEKVLLIKELLLNKNISQTKIANMFNVSPTVISSIKLNKTWTHVKFKNVS